MKNKKTLAMSTLVLVSALVGCGGNTISQNGASEETSNDLTSEVVSETKSEGTSVEVSSEIVSQEPNLEAKKLYVVGDSTACSFNDSTYYYPRYGFGTQINNYFYSSLEIVNLALSGRSSKSFLAESNYLSLKNNISAGDYVLIAFGHNDEKSDDPTRFTDATLPTTDTSSFKYSLYENYIKMVEEKGAIPILATPIVRLSTSDDYAGSNGHVTETGDYSQAIRDLGIEKNVPVIDLTRSTKSLYEELTFTEAKWFHAMTAGKKDTDGVTIVADTSSIDKTHLNIYGAKMVAYLFANEIKESTFNLKDYVCATLAAPTKENDLISNSSYVYTDYTPFDGESYSPAAQFTTISEGWYGTAFGDTGGDPTSASNGYVAKEETEGVFTVGQIKDGTSYKGKISSAADGIAFLFRKVDASKNFTLTAEAKILTELDTNQAGFGLMLRDDSYVPTRNAALVGNYVTSGLLCESNGTMKANFSRTGAGLVKGSTSVDGLYQVDDTASLSITRLGQRVTVSLTYKDQTYTLDHLDFPLQERDQENMYIGMFATRGTTVEFTNVNFEVTGDAIEA